MTKFYDIKPKKNLYWQLEESMFPYRKEIIGLTLIILSAIGIFK